MCGVWWRAGGVVFDGGPQVRGTQEGLRGSMIGAPEGKKRKDRACSHNERLEGQTRHKLIKNHTMRRSRNSSRGTVGLQNRPWCVPGEVRRSAAGLFACVGWSTTYRSFSTWRRDTKTREPNEGCLEDCAHKMQKGLLSRCCTEE